MTPEIFSLAVLGALLIFVMLGIPVLISLGTVSFVGLWVLTGNFNIAINNLARTSVFAVADYVYIVIPMFLLMGEIIAQSGAAMDLYRGFSRLLRKVPGRLAVATVAGNAVLAAIVGVSIAAAATFSKIAFPVMKRFGYDKGVALGSIAGSSALGMLIPPSILMIIWGIISGQSIGALFVAGIIPGIIVCCSFMLFCVINAILHPEKYGTTHRGTTDAVMDHPLVFSEWIGVIGCGGLVTGVIGGIWLGIFTTIEAAAVGVLGSLVIAAIKRMPLRKFAGSVSIASRMSATILLLMIFAQLYSRILTLGGVGTVVDDAISTLGGGGFGKLMILAIVWIIMGMFVDSISIVLLTLPVFLPIIAEIGVDMMALSIAGILLIEAGIISPPFGLAVYTVKLCIDEPDVTVMTIFKASFPYVLILVAVAILLIIVPELATWLPKLAFGQGGATM